MPRSYDQLVEYAFKRFSVINAWRTVLPTALYHCKQPALAPSEKPVLFTMTILPSMMTVWYHCARKALGDAVDIVIFDSSGKLRSEQFPEAHVQKYLNLYAATKSDQCLYITARHRETVWLCDDDVFITGQRCLEILQREFAEPKTALVSFRGRKWWEFEIDGQRFTPCSSYCTAIKRSIFADQLHLSCRPSGG